MKLCTKYTIMERHTFTINFSASPSKCRKNGLMPIYATITQNGERASFTTGKYIHPNDWDAVKQKARGTSDSSRTINNYPSSYKKDLDSYRLQYQKEIGLLKKGISLRNISSLTGTSVNTIRKVKELCMTELND